MICGRMWGGYLYRGCNEKYLEWTESKWLWGQLPGQLVAQGGSSLLSSFVQLDLFLCKHPEFFILLLSLRY